MNPKLRYFVPLGIAITALCMLQYVVGHQILRQSANDPQTQIAEDAALQIAHITTPPAVPPQKVDMVKSLSPYIILYNDRGQAVLGNVQLDGKVPVPPKGVFDYVRTHQKEAVTWEPRKGVRHAVVVVRVDGEHKGFVLAGRSLREVEKRFGQLLAQILFVWLITLFVSFVATTFFFSSSPPRTK